MTGSTAKRNRSLVAEVVLAGFLLVAVMGAPAGAVERAYRVIWSGAPANSATATGLLVIDDSVINNPGSTLLIGGRLRVVVQGASNGNGAFEYGYPFDFDFAYDNVVLDTGLATLDFSTEFVGQSGWGSTTGGLTLSASAFGSAPDSVSAFTIRPNASADDMTLISVTPYPDAVPLEQEALLCQKAIGKAIGKLSSTFFKLQSKCRDAFLKGKPLYQDEGGTIPVTTQRQCVAEYKSAAKFVKAGEKARKTIANPNNPTCTDALVGQLHTCAASVDGLLAADGQSGCLLSAAVNAAGFFLIDQGAYGY